MFWGLLLLTPILFSIQGNKAMSCVFSWIEQCEGWRGAFPSPGGVMDFTWKTSWVLGIIACPSETAKSSVNKPEFVGGVGLERAALSWDVVTKVLQLFHKQNSY